MRAALRLGLPLILVILALDQASKEIVLRTLERPMRVTGFFDLVLVWNRGVSFGMLNSLGAYGPWLLTGFAVIVALALAVWLVRAENLGQRLALSLVIAGALGNAIDRVRFGAVVDFISLHAGGYYWPAFNVADSAICIGAGLLLIDSLRRSPRQSSEQPSSRA